MSKNSNELSPDTNIQRVDTSTSAADLPELEHVHSLTPNDLPELESTMSGPLDDVDDVLRSTQSAPTHRRSSQNLIAPGPSFIAGLQHNSHNRTATSNRKPTRSSRVKNDTTSRIQLKEKHGARVPFRSSRSFKSPFSTPKSPRHSYHNPIIKRQPKPPFLEPFNRDRKNPRTPGGIHNTIDLPLREPPSLTLDTKSSEKGNRVRSSTVSLLPMRCPQSPPPSSRPLNAPRTFPVNESLGPKPNNRKLMTHHSLPVLDPHAKNQPRRKSIPVSLLPKLRVRRGSHAERKKEGEHDVAPSREESDESSHSRRDHSNERDEGSKDNSEKESDKDDEEEGGGPISSLSFTLTDDDGDSSIPLTLTEMLSRVESRSKHRQTAIAPASEPVRQRASVPPKIVVDSSPPDGSARSKTPDSYSMTRQVSSPVNSANRSQKGTRFEHRRTKSMSFSRAAGFERSTSQIFSLETGEVQMDTSPQQSPRLRSQSPPFPVQTEDISPITLGEDSDDERPNNSMGSLGSSDSGSLPEFTVTEESGEEKIQKQYLEGTIFITGVTGFLGKVLLLRILESLPSVEQVYVLVRNSGDITGAQRLHELFYESDCFEKLRTHSSDFAKLLGDKVTAVQGDLTEEMLGISPSYLRHLTPKINYVIHCASARDSNLSLEGAMRVNVIGSLNVMNLAKSCKNCKAFVYVSSFNAFRNLHGIKPEKLDDIDFLPFDVVNTVKNRPNKLKSIQENFLKNWSSTYVLTKVMAEHVLKNRSGATPLVIMRLPPIGSAYKSPEYGWSDKLTTTGTLGTAVAAGLKVMLGRKDTSVGMIPVDFCANALLTSIPYVLEKRKTFVVFNLVSHTADISNLGFLCETWQDYFHQYPIQFASPVEVDLIPDKKQFSKMFEETYKGYPRESIKMMRTIRSKFGDDFRTEYRHSCDNMRKLLQFLDPNGNSRHNFPIDFPHHYQGDELAEYLEAECRCSAVHFSHELHKQITKMYTDVHKEAETARNQDPLWEEWKTFLRQLDIEEKYADAFCDKKIRPDDILGLSNDELKELIPDIVPRSILQQHIVFEKKSNSTVSSAQSHEMDLSPRSSSESVVAIQRQYSQAAKKAELPDAVFSSYAQKKSPSGLKNLRPWQRRFFMLSEEALLWFKKQSQPRPLGILSLRSIHYVRANQQSRLDIIISGRKLELKMENRRTRDNWLDYFEQQRVVVERNAEINEHIPATGIVRPQTKLGWRKRRKSIK